MALPAEFAYGQLKPAAAPARGYVGILNPEAGTKFTGSSMVTIHVPCGRSGEYLHSPECSLCFKVTNNGLNASANNDAEFSGGAWACIQKLEILMGSELLESIDSYAELHNLMYDMTTSSEYRTGIGHAMHGTAQHTYSSEITPMEPGDMLKGATVARNGGTYFAAIQLMSFLVGTTAERALPIGMCSADLRIEITFNSDAHAFVSAGTPVIEYSDVQFHAQIIQLDPEIDREVARANNGVLSFHAATFRTFQHSITSLSTFDIINLPMRYSSLRYCLSIIRPASNINNQTTRSVDAREKATLTSFQLRRGSELVPQRPVPVTSDNIAQVTLELLKIFGKLESLGADHGCLLMDKALFTADNVSASGAQGTFVFGCDITPFSGSLDDLSTGGANTLGQPLHLECSFTSVPHDLRVTSFSNYDILVMVDLSTGLISTRA